MSGPAGSAYDDAELYDVIYSWYRDDVDFYVATARAAPGPVLEVGCGTGRVLLPILAAGVDIDGLDASREMLALLRRKAAAVRALPRAVRGDMRDFTMPRRYGLVTIPFRAFLHMATIDDQLRALRCVREHLEPGGTLVLNVFYPSKTYIHEHHDRRILERELPHPETGAAVRVYSTSRFDTVAQAVTTDREVEIADPQGGAPATHRQSFTLRWVYLYEMELLLQAAGFSRWQVWGGFDGRPLEKDTDEMVWTAWSD